VGIVLGAMAGSAMQSVGVLPGAFFGAVLGAGIALALAALKDGYANRYGRASRHRRAKRWNRH
jgi:hypothetical protein